MPAMERPVGVFDSGVGGLSVLREVRRELPEEDLVYIADSAYAPYGDRSTEFLQRRSSEIVAFLLEQGAKAIVVACNTATGAAIETLRPAFAVPFVGIEPAVKPAAKTTKSGVIGVLATAGTLASRKFSRLLAEHGRDVEVLVQACPGLVEEVEKGELAGPKTRSIVEQCVRPLVEGGADVIVLGCTHYPFVDAVIRDVAGPGVTVIDPAVAVARELRRVLQVSGLLAGQGREGTERFWTSGQPELVRPVTAQLWAREVDMRALPESLRIQP